MTTFEAPQKKRWQDCSAAQATKSAPHAVVGSFDARRPAAINAVVPAKQRRTSQNPHPLQSASMFAARPFTLNTATAALAGVAVRAITTKTTTIKG
ncbi:hypothetical protein LJR129_003423 [Acidovorax sp. LjRoot129]|uniref:hypothetical protein n=1 Tax=Acidovorax sp. LjRoot129 TaxID=3342260 RepID=UPI003ECE1589